MRMSKGLNQAARQTRIAARLIRPWLAMGARA